MVILSYETSATNNRIICSQLLLFIAEIAGVPSKSLEADYKTLRDYEDENNLKDKEKNGDYIRGNDAFIEFKLKIHISDLVKIIKNAENWDEVREKAMKL